MEDSKRHVPSYTTLVPRWRGMAHSCSACVSGMRWVLYVRGGALRVFARVVGLLERRDVVHGCPSLGEVTQWRDVRAIIRAEFARSPKKVSRPVSPMLGLNVGVLSRGQKKLSLLTILPM